MLAAAGAVAQAQDASDASAPDEPVVLTVGTTVDLITDNPWAVSAGSDWSVVTAQYDMLLKFDERDLVARAEPGDRLRAERRLDRCGPARSATT